MCDTTLNVSPRAARLQWLRGSLGELLMLPRPVHKLLPTYQQLAMVKDGQSGFWMICWGCVQSFQTITSAVGGDIGCTFIPFSCQNGITDVVASSLTGATLSPVRRGEGFTEVLQDTVVSEVSTSTFLLGSLALISSERCVLKIHLLLCM